MVRESIYDARILIVDDNESNVRLLTGFLQQAGYRSLQGTTRPTETFSLYRAFDPDLILLDLVMPELGGFKVLEQLATLIPPDRYLPILVLTAETSPEAKQRALSSGAKDFLTKPFDRVEVLLRIRNLLEARWLHLQLQSQNERLEQAVQQRTRQLQALHRLSEIALEQGTVEGNLQRIVEEIGQATAFPLVGLELYDADRGTLTLVGSRGWQPISGNGRLESPVARSLSSRALESDEPLLLAPPPEEARYAGQPLGELDIRTFLALPLKVQGSALGVLSLAHPALVRAEPPLLDLLDSVADRVAALLERRRSEEERKELLAREQQARREAEQAAELLTALHALTEAALATLELEALLSELLTRLCRVLEVDTAAILLLEGESLVTRAARGLEEEVEQELRVPLGHGFAGRVVAERRAVFLEDIRQQEIYSPVLRAKGLRSLFGVPLLVEGHPVGVLHVGTLKQRNFTARDEELLRLVADRAALAIEHARLFEAERAARARAEASERQQSFLATASALLASSLDYQATLTQIARLAVPHIADWCAIDVVDEKGKVQRLAVTHVDPDKVEWAKELQQRYPPQLDAPHGMPNVLRTGKSEFYPEIPDELLVQTARDEEHLHLLRAVGFTSAMIVPLVVREQILGGIMLVSAESGRRYDEGDLVLAEDLARRAALAVENAKLYSAVQQELVVRKKTEQALQQAKEELEHRVAQRTAELQELNQRLQRELSERALAQEGLRKSEERFRALVQNATDIILVLDVEGIIRYQSPGVERVLGYKPEELVGQRIFDLIHPDDLEHSLDALARSVKRPHVDIHLETRVRHKQGSWCRMEGTGRNLLHEPAVGGVVVNARDITQRRENEIALQEANWQLGERVGELERRNLEISLLNEMGDLLQSCLTIEEAYAVLEQSIPELFPFLRGTLYIFDSPHEQMVPVVAWGEPEVSAPVFNKDDCWGLRRTRVHEIQAGRSGLYCAHFRRPLPCSSLCVPMIALGENLGLLVLAGPKEGRKGEGLLQAKRQLAGTVAEHVGLALANLRLREKLQGLSIRDPLTGLFNRRYLEETLDRELQRAERGGATRRAHHFRPRSLQTVQ